MKPPRFQFRLRTLFYIVAIVAALAWIIAQEPWTWAPFNPAAPPAWP
jgi:hypothetical protein